jgi:hypothetical protein
VHYCGPRATPDTAHPCARSGQIRTPFHATHVAGLTVTLRQDVRVSFEPYVKVQIWLRTLPPSQQKDLAIALASLVEPFAAVSDEGQPVQGLPAVARMVRDAQSHVEVERARDLLFTTPDFELGEEPVGRAWFSFGATVAWIYAADSLATDPSDGVANAYMRVLDLLGHADETLGDTTLTDHLMDLLDRMMHDGTAGLGALNSDVRQAVRRLRGEA